MKTKLSIYQLVKEAGLSEKEAIIPLDEFVERMKVKTKELTLKNER